MPAPPAVITIYVNLLEEEEGGVVVPVNPAAGAQEAVPTVPAVEVRKGWERRQGEGSEGRGGGEWREEGKRERKEGNGGGGGVGEGTSFSLLPQSALYNR